MAHWRAVLLLPLFAICVAGLYENGVTVSCDDGNMTVSLEKQSFLYLNASQLHLRGYWYPCWATESSTHLFLSTALNDCWTTVMETEDSLIFSNEIYGEVQVYNSITRDHDFELQFNCTYSRKRFLSLSFTPDGIVMPPGEEGFGNLTFKLDFYRSNSYTTPYYSYDYPLNVPLNEYVYVKYSVESSADLVVIAENCKATKDGSYYSSPSYYLIQNGCKRDTTLDYYYDSSQSAQQFSFKTFRFFNDYDTVYFHCELLACNRNTPNSRCSQGCVNNKKRRKREVTTSDESEQPSTTKAYQIKRGPIMITEKKEELKDSGSTDKQAVMIGSVTAAGGFAVLAIIGLVVLFIKYRIARLMMNRNKVGDLYTTQDEQLSRQNAYIQEGDMIEKDETMSKRTCISKTIYLF